MDICKADINSTITHAVKDLYYNKQVRFLLLHSNGIVKMYDEKSVLIGALPKSSPIMDIMENANINEEIYLRNILAI